MDSLCDNMETRDAAKYLNMNGRYRVVPNPTRTYKGKCSWFGNFDGINMWDDSDEDNGENASGISQDIPGIAYMCEKTLRHWWIIKFPNGKTFTVQQVDIGPANITGKIIDINAALADKAGYSPRTFPTGANLLFKYVGPKKP